MSSGHEQNDGGGDGDQLESATKICPDCAETVLAQARACRYCGYRFDATRRRSQLEQLAGGLFRRERPVGLQEILADWGFAPAGDETVRYFRPATVEGSSGYLVVTDRRVAFFGQVARRRHEQLLQHELRELSGVAVHGRRVRRRIVLSFGAEQVVVRDDGGRREAVAMVEHLSAIAGS